MKKGCYASSVTALLIITKLYHWLKNRWRSPSSEADEKILVSY